MMKKTGLAMVLEEFEEPLYAREFPIPGISDKEVLVKILASGVCGSDVHMWHGKDPRTPLPIILGHEGVGIIERIGTGQRDICGEALKEGDLVSWNRGVTCDRCYYCTIKKEPSLCTDRKVYGINISCKEPPHFRGCYSEYLHLYPNTKILKITEEIQPEILVAASCSGATSAHTNELCGISEGDFVVVQGPGPLGLFALAFALDSGAGEVVVIGTPEDRERLKIAREFGASAALSTGETSFEERLEFVKEKTQGRGADVVIDATGSPQALPEGIKLTARGGTYALPGIAVPVGQIPISFYEDVALKNLRIQGVWVSDTRHFYQAVKLVLSKKYPFEKLVTHVFSLKDATKAMEVMEGKEAIKAVLKPWEETL